YLFQDYALFPHLTVRQNIGFGLRRGWFNPHGRRALPEQARRWVRAFGLDALMDRYPVQLSGGQRQRVALARALSTGPGLLLLDEPLSALDAGLRARMREELAQLQRDIDIPTVLITHDLADVQALADEVFHIEHGEIQGRAERVERGDGARGGWVHFMSDLNPPCRSVRPRPGTRPGPRRREQGRSPGRAARPAPRGGPGGWWPGCSPSGRHRPCDGRCGRPSGSDSRDRRRRARAGRRVPRARCGPAGPSGRPA